MLGQADQSRRTLVYGFAHFGKSLFWYAGELLFAYFLTETVGLPVAKMGIVIAVGFLASALIDLAVGAGLRRPFTDPAAAGRTQLAGAVASSAALGIFFLIGLVSPDRRFACAMAAGVAFRAAFALYDLPQNALMALATDDERGRLRLASTRIWFSGAATLLVATAVGPLVARTGSGGRVLAAMTAGFALVAIGGAALLAREVRTAGGASDRQPAIAPVRRCDRTFPLLLVTALITGAFTPAFAKVAPYFGAYALRSAWWAMALVIMLATGITLSQPIWYRLATRLSPPRMLMAAAAAQVTALAAFWAAGARAPAASALAAFAFGVGNGGAGMLQWAMLSDAIARRPQGRTGLAYGLFVASNKIGLAAGGLLIAGVLAANEFRSVDSSALAMLMAGLPALGAALLALNGAALQRASLMGEPRPP